MTSMQTTEMQRALVHHGIIVPILNTREQARQTGRRCYFSGRRCCRGHLSARYTSSGGCVECKKQDYGSLMVHHVKPKVARSRKKNIRTDYSHLTDAQVDAWFERVRNIRANSERYKHRPLEERGIIFHPEPRQAVESTK